MRQPDSLPDPTRPAGSPTAALPFDHIVCLMQENHSFDNYFGMLPRRGQPKADGFTFDMHGTPLNSNPYKGGIARVLHAPTSCQPSDVSQSWNATHQEIDHGKMDGFARTIPGQMYYYDEQDIPFYYSFAKTFTLGNRWFCSAPCQTYPNRRFYLAGTAFGLISTDNASVNQVPPNGTIFDRLNAHNISWKDYFVDVPGTGVIDEICISNPDKMAPISQFFADCKSGNASRGQLGRPRDRCAQRSRLGAGGQHPDRQRRLQLHRGPGPGRGEPGRHPDRRVVHPAGR